MTWTADIPVKVEETHPETPEVRALSLVTGDVSELASTTIQLGVRVDGAWHPAVNIPPLRLEDAPEPPEVAALPAEDPEADKPAEPPGQAKKDGTDMADAILTAKIDGDTPLAQQFGIPDGTLLSEALPQITWGLLYPDVPIQRGAKR